jgi:hypothetical protein
MIRLAVMMAAITAPMTVLAQATAPITATPLLPPASLPQQTMPGVDQSQPAPQTAAPTPAPNTPQPMQLTWVPQNTALLQVLDKVNAQNAELTVKVGSAAQFGSLSIQVQACDVHPPDQVQDSAAYLNIVDSHGDTPAFHGWMLANDPSLSMLQNPMYDVRVVGCRT